MPETEHLRVQLDYPLEQVKEPIIYHLVTEFRLIPNIRRANIDVHTGGMMVLENVFVLDAASRSVAREEVLRLTDSEDPIDNILRIRFAP